MLKTGDRVYHYRFGHLTTEGFCIILNIEGTRATVRWEHNGKQGGVETRGLISEDKAQELGLAV
jgi:hypothetical protein